jgi:hypothetical protein
MSKENEDRIEMLEAHITLINKDLAKLAYYVKEDCSEFLEANKLKRYTRQDKGE